MSPELQAITATVTTAAEAARDELVDLCSQLVAAPSVNPAGDTRQVADVVAAALRRWNVGCRLAHLDPTMPSVVAELASGRPGPHLVLNVHLDTMPPGDEAAWTVPVWQLTRSDGRLYGLGMGNMKGAVAAMTWALAHLAGHASTWSGRVTFLAVSDEVVFGDNGAAWLLESDPGLRGDGLICGEGPGFCRTAIGEKGVLWLRLSAQGPAGHSSAATRGQSAAARIAAAVTAVDDLTGRTGSLPPELSALRHRSDDLGLTLTANVGTISAGTFIGQRATTATAEVDLRLPPGQDADAVESSVREAVASTGAVVQRIKGWDANWTAPATALVRHWDAAHEAITGKPGEHAIRLPASDASRWRRTGVPALCYGPQPGYSAGVDDYAEEDEVVRCAAM